MVVCCVYAGLFCLFAVLCDVGSIWFVVGYYTRVGLLLAVVLVVVNSVVLI